jgi:hypothetical protein
VLVLVRRKRMDLHYIIPYTIGLVGAVILLFFPFSTYRYASWWLRSLFLLASPALIAWAGLGFFLLSHEQAHHSDLSYERLWSLSHLKSDFAGVALGFLIALVISPEFRKHPRRSSVSA